MGDLSTIKRNDEHGRLAALSRYDVEKLQSKKEFSDIVQVIKSIFSISNAAITTIDSHRLWMRASAGASCADFPREDTFCNVTIEGDQPFAVSDALEDGRFSDSPLVTGDAAIRSYLGVPLTTPDGYNVGALCLFDTEPRVFTEGEKAILANFGKIIVSQLELRQSASVDRLTGAQTRHVFEEYLARCDQPDGRAFLLLLDIDHFKQINDTFGHHVGDEALRHVSNIIRSVVDKADKFGRLGGEEFAIFMQNSRPTAAWKRAEDIRTAIASSHLSEIGDRKITVSIGISGFAVGEPVKYLLQRADTALYHAKRSGRNRTVAWPVSAKMAPSGS